jgi:hypothetical protein
MNNAESEVKSIELATVKHRHIEEPFEIVLGDDSTSVSSKGDPEDLIRPSTVDEDPKLKQARHKQLAKIFMMLFVCMFVARTDQGIVPALNTRLKQEFNFTSV